LRVRKVYKVSPKAIDFTNFTDFTTDAVILCFCLIEALDNLAVDDQGNGGSQCDYSKIIPDVMGITAGSEPFATSGEQAFVRAIFT